MLSEIPEEWKAHSYIQTRPYNFEQTFKNANDGQIMTELEMLKEGIIYKYEQIGRYKRSVC